MLQERNSTLVMSKVGRRQTCNKLDRFSRLRGRLRSRCSGDLEKLGIQGKAGAKYESREARDFVASHRIGRLMHIASAYAAHVDFSNAHAYESLIQKS
jgi:hypothetical protein